MPPQLEKNHVAQGWRTASASCRRACPLGRRPDLTVTWGQEERGMTEDKMAGWHYRLDGPISSVGALACVCAKSLQSCLTLCDPIDSSVHGILQAGILEWIAMPSSRGSSGPRNRTCVSYVLHWLFLLPVSLRPDQPPLPPSALPLTGDWQLCSHPHWGLRPLAGNQDGAECPHRNVRPSGWV